MKIKLKRIKKGKLLFYAIAQTLTVISLSAYSWRPSLNTTNSLPTPVKNLESSNHNLTFKKYNSTNELNDSVGAQIEAALKKVHTTFQNKYAEIKDNYPPSLNDEHLKLTTYAMTVVTDPKTAYYEKLRNQILLTITHNILIDKFYKPNSPKLYDAQKQNIILPDYLKGQAVTRASRLTEGEINFVLNTLTSQEKATKVQAFLDNMVSYLTKTPTTFGMSWYSQIPAQLKIYQEFNKPLSDDNYIKMIDTLSTDRANNPIVQTGYKLSESQKEIDRLLKNQATVDSAKIQSFVESANSNLFIDQTPTKIAEAFNFSSAEIALLKTQFPNWNYYFSQAKFIEINPELLQNNDNNLIKLYDAQFYYGTRRNRITPPKINYLLKLNNALYPDVENTSSRQNKYYENNNQMDGAELLSKLFSVIKNDITQNFSSYFVLKPSSKNKIANTITQGDYEETQKLKNLKNLLKIDLNFVLTSPSNANEANSLQENNWLAKVTLKLTSSESLENRSRNPLYEKEEMFDVLVIKEKNDAQADFENALELDPIFQRQYSSVPVATIINEINKKEQKYFKFNNQKPTLNYQTTQAEITPDGNVKLTIEITSKVIPNLRKTYQKIIDKTVFIKPDAFDLQAYTEAQKINTTIRQKYGNDIYNAKMNPEAEQLLFQRVLLVTKTSEGFNDLNLEAKLDLFKNNYQKALLILLLNQEGDKKDELTEKINNYYSDLSNRLDVLFKQAGINPESELAKSLKAQIAKAHANALADKNNFDQKEPMNQELADILNILDSKNIDQDLINSFGKFIEKYNYNDIQKVLNQTQKSVLYSVSGLAGIILLGSSYLMFRSMKIDAQRFRIRKSMLGTLSGFLILASGASLVYLIVYLLGAV